MSLTLDFKVLASLFDERGGAQKALMGTLKKVKLKPTTPIKCLTPTALLFFVYLQMMKMHFLISFKPSNAFSPSRKSLPHPPGGGHIS